MPEPLAEKDAIRETLLDFAEWRGDSIEAAKWAVDTYLSERVTPPEGGRGNA